MCRPDPYTGGNLRRLFKTFICMIMLFNLFCSAAFGEEEKIGEVLIKGNRRIEAAAILNVVKLRKGDLLDNGKVDNDIRAIYNLGHFRDVKAVTQQGGQRTNPDLCCSWKSR